MNQARIIWFLVWSLALGAIGAQAETLGIKSVGTGLYLSWSDDGEELVANSRSPDAAESFERLYSGNSYFILGSSSHGLIVFSDATHASGDAAAKDATQFSMSVPRASDGAVTIRVGASGPFLAIDPNADNALTANESSASSDYTWFILETITDTPTTVTLDFTDPRQTVQGFGASLAFYAGWLTAHPNKQEIYSALFDRDNGLGLSVLRLGNWFRYQSNPDFDRDAAEFVRAAASIRGGSPIPILMSSWSPPRSLKSNGAEGCPGTRNCTLAMVDRAFVYEGFAKYWTDSIAAYRNLGVDPAWISLQNEPDWIGGYDSCRFDPSESVVDGITYAGYDKALEAVADALGKMDSPPVIIGPEVVGIGYNQLTNYMAKLDPALMGAIAHHLYHGRTVEIFDSIRSSYGSLPRFQTEFSSRDYHGFRLAWLIHDSLVVEETSVYLHWGAVWSDSTEFPQELIHIDFPWDRNRWTTDRGWKPNDQFYAMEHFSRYVQPGFTRYTAWTNDAALRVSAFANADMSRIVIVALNTSDSAAVVPAFAFDGMAERTSAVYRTGFADSSEQFEMVGALDAGGAVNLPPQSAATIVFDLVP